MAEMPRIFLATPLAPRGLHDVGQGIIENSPSAIRRAVQAGYGIEIDVQLSADGVAMVFHDDTLDRLTALQGPVSARNAADLGQVRLTGSDDTIPTLAQVLDIVAGQEPLLIELKDQSGGLGAAEPILEQAVAADLAGYGGPVAVMSFNPHMVTALKDAAPHIPRGLTTCGFIPSQWPQVSPEQCTILRSIAAFGQVGARFISHDWTDLGSPRVAELKGLGVPVLCWTIKNPQTETEARRVADTITFEGYMPRREG